jgi:tetratricopeptide (TPR) repeat protein
MKKFETTFLSTALVILPLIFAILFDLTPFSKIIQAKWNLIKSLESTGQEGNWIEEGESILKQQPWQASLWAKLAEKQFTNGNFEGVIDSLKMMEKYQSLNFDQMIMIGQAYMESGQSEEAFEAWQIASTYQNLTRSNYQDLSQLQQTENDWYGAYQTILNWQLNFPDDPNMKYSLVLSQLIFDPHNAAETASKIKNSRLTTIQDEIKNILDNENTIFQYILAGNYLSRIGEWAYASAAYTYATRLDPDYAEGWALYGNALLKLGKNGYFAIEKANNLDTDSKIARAFLASYYRTQNMFEESLSIYEGLSKEEPDQAVWAQEIGNTYVMAGDLENALKYFKEATDIEPDNADNWLNLAEFCGNYKVNLEETGLPAARQALAIDESYWRANDVMGWLYVVLENYTTAERFLTAAYETNPELDIVNLHLGQLFSLEGKKELSTYFLNRSIEFTNSSDIKQLAEKFMLP